MEVRDVRRALNGNMLVDAMAHHNSIKKKKILPNGVEICWECYGTSPIQKSVTYLPTNNGVELYNL